MLINTISPIENHNKIYLDQGRRIQDFPRGRPTKNFRTICLTSPNSTHVSNPDLDTKNILCTNVRIYFEVVRSR